MDIEEKDLHYLKLLAKRYPSIRVASTEIINLNAILNLPKGTEHFISDIHGEFEAFLHVLKNGSGSIKRKIDEIFGNTLLEKEKRSLATLIFYPRRKRYCTISVRINCLAVDPVATYVNLTRRGKRMDGGHTLICVLFSK